MKEVLIEGYKFIKVHFQGAEMFFSTGENGLDFNKVTYNGKKNTENIKKWFGVDKVGFLDQIHSDFIIEYNGEIQEGDALITNRKNMAIGVFTADCVPILLYDKNKNVIAAVHSGWKGTFECILLKTIQSMEQLHETDPKDLLVCIGPHIHECCYEVSEELIDKFKNSHVYKNLDISSGRHLNMKKCILHQLHIKGVDQNNIKDLDICTFCNNDYKMHSYRKDKNGGRLFSFVFLR